MQVRPGTDRERADVGAAQCPGTAGGGRVHRFGRVSPQRNTASVTTRFIDDV
jgi:hypothetical protein